MRNSLIYIIILVAAVILLYQLFPTSPKPTEVGLEQAITMSQDGEIAAITVDNQELLITTLDGRELKTAIGNLTLVDLQELGLNLDGVDYDVKPSGFDWSGLLIGFLPLILFGALIFFLFRSARGANSQAMNFGRSRARLIGQHAHRNLRRCRWRGRSQAGADRSGRIPQVAGEIPEPGGAHPQGHFAHRPPRHGQDATGQSRSRRSRRALLLHQRQRIRRDVRRRRRFPRARPLRPGQAQHPLHHLYRRD